MCVRACARMCVRLPEFSRTCVCLRLCVRETIYRMPLSVWACGRGRGSGGRDTRQRERAMGRHGECVRVHVCVCVCAARELSSSISPGVLVLGCEGGLSLSFCHNMSHQKDTQRHTRKHTHTLPEEIMSRWGPVAPDKLIKTPTRNLSTRSQDQSLLRRLRWKR